MTKAKLLQPNLVLGGTIVNITPKILRQHHLKGLILDVDETLVPLKQSEIPEEVLTWVNNIRQVASLWLVSNNISETRIGGIARKLDIPHMASARKPSRKKLRQAAQKMDLPVEQVAMVGDRLLTDVLAGNRLGMFTILVEPMVDPDAIRHYHLRNFEVWLSQLFEVSLINSQQNLNKADKSSSN